MVMRTMLVVSMALLAAACGREEAPPQVSFSRDVMPILQERCVECHQPGEPGFAASGLDLTSYEGVMAGTSYGPMVMPGDPGASNLVRLVEGRADPSIQMPHGDVAGLYQGEIQTLRTWVEQGAPHN